MPPGRRSGPILIDINEAMVDRGLSGGDRSDRNLGSLKSANFRKESQKERKRRRIKETLNK